MMQKEQHDRDEREKKEEHGRPSMATERNNQHHKQTKEYSTGNHNNLALFG